MTRDQAAVARPIVVGTDGSRCSMDALQWAAREALRRQLPLRVVRVFDPIRTVASALDTLPPIESQRISAETALSEAVGSVDVEVETERLMVRGNPVKELGALSTDAEMLVVGSRGLGNLASLLLGSTSLRLAMHASCPVVVVRPQVGHGTGPSAGRVVAGVDSGPQTAQVLELAFAECVLRGSGLTAVHTYEPPDHAFSPDASLRDWPQLHEREQALLTERLSRWREEYPVVDVIEKTMRGYLAPALIAESRGAELLVIAREGRGGLRDAVLGTVCGAVLHHAECPVVVLPAGS